MMKKWCSLFLVTLIWICAGFLLFDSPDSNSPRPAEVPQRIVSASPNITETLFALGLDDRIVGVSSDSNFPKKAKSKPKVGNFWQPNIEAVIAAKPELVISCGFTQQKQMIQRLRRMGINALFLKNESLADFFNVVDTIGLATGKNDEAQNLVEGIKQKFQNIQSNAPTQKPKVLCIVQRTPLRAAGTETFVNEMIELAGGVNAIGKTIQKYPPISSEYLLTCQADVIIEPAMGFDDIPTQQASALEFWKKYKTLPAVQNDRIYVVNGDLICRTGPRIVKGVETIAKCLKPENPNR